MYIYTKKTIAIATYAFTYLAFVHLPQKDLGLFTALDCINRFNNELNYLFNVHFLWTNIHYIYFYFLPYLLLLFTLYSTFKHSSCHFKSLLIIGMLPLIDALTVTSCNLTLDSGTHVNTVNVLLMNTVNKYHPLLLYVSFLFLPFMLVANHEGVKLKKCRATCSFQKWLPLVTLLTLYMGSWWAYQEGSWGGWWAWDSSESFGLIIFLSVVVLQHSGMVVKLLLSRKSLILLMFSASLFSYLLLQMNFSTTSHDFGLSANSESFAKTWYSVALLTCLALVYLWSLRENKTLLTPAFNVGLAVPKINYQLTNLVSLISLSFVPLLTSLYWKLLTINILNFTANYHFLLYLLCYCLIAWYGVGNRFTLIVLLAAFLDLMFIECGLLTLFFTLIKVRKNKLTYLHSTVLALIFFSLVAGTYLFYGWRASCSAVETPHYIKSLSCFGLEYVTSPYFGVSATGSEHNTTNAIISSESTSTGSVFSLDLKQGFISQNFLPDNPRAHFSSCSLDNLSYVLLTALASAVLMFTSFSTNTFKASC
jgi:cytochrome c biogenesis factor